MIRCLYCKNEIKDKKGLTKINGRPYHNSCGYKKYSNKPKLNVLLVLIMLTFFTSISYSIIMDGYDSGNNGVDNLHEIGDNIIIETEIETETYSYLQKQELILTGYKPTYTDVITQETVCIYNNVTEIEECDTQDVTTVETDRYGLKVLEYGKITQLNLNNRVIDTNYKNCWVCSQKYIACLSKLDGGENIIHRSEKFKCDNDGYPVLRSGESGFIYDIETSQNLEYKNDIGVLI